MRRERSGPRCQTKAKAHQQLFSSGDLPENGRKPAQKRSRFAQRSFFQHPGGGGVEGRRLSFWKRVATLEADRELESTSVASTKENWLARERLTTERKKSCAQQCTDKGITRKI